MNDFHALVELLTAEYERLHKQNLELQRVTLARTRKSIDDRQTERGSEWNSNCGGEHSTVLRGTLSGQHSQDDDHDCVYIMPAATEVGDAKRVPPRKSSGQSALDRESFRDCEIAQESWTLSKKRVKFPADTSYSVAHSYLSDAKILAVSSDFAINDPADITLCVDHNESSPLPCREQKYDDNSCDSGHCRIESVQTLASSGAQSRNASSRPRAETTNTMRSSESLMSETMRSSESFDPCAESVQLSQSLMVRLSILPEYGVLSPTGKPRLVWETLWVFACLLELWIVTFELSFLGLTSTSPLALQILGIIVTAFFGVDIILSFSTGYIEGDIAVMDRSRIVRRYIRCWFWIDLLAALPFDIILTSSTNVIGFARMAKLPKVLKAFRYMRIIKVTDVVMIKMKASSMDSEESLVLRAVKALALPMPFLFLLILLAHINGCTRSSFDSYESLDVADAFRHYYANFWIAYLELAAGRFRNGDALNGNPLSLGLWTYEIVVASQRLAVLALVAYWIVVRQDLAQLTIVKEGALRFLKRHEVSTATQLQLLQSLRETRDVRLMQHHFNLLSSEMPESLRRKICREMWESKLVSLGLLMRVSKWTNEFIGELVLYVSEDILAPRTVLFHEDEFSTAAYHIIQGVLMEASDISVAGIDMQMRMHSTSTRSMQENEYTVGMWVGEMALVNSDLRRGLTLVAQVITRLMVVNAQDFCRLLSKWGLESKFAQLCENHLFRGICGRCGAFGEHMPNECPLFRRRLKKGTTWAELAKASANDQSEKEMGRGLKDYISKYELWRLIPSFKRLDIWKIEDLFALVQDLKPLSEDLEKNGEDIGGGLTSAEKRALSLKSVKRFRKQLAESVKRNLMHRGLRKQHLIFLSHYKVEAGTEAALMRSELDTLICEGKDPTAIGRLFDSPTFLDSEDLQDLGNLTERVQNSHNVALLLTQGVLTRPWCLVEIVTALKFGVPVIPVEVIKPGSKFQFPDDEFYERMARGEVLRSEDIATLEACGVTLDDVLQTLRDVFHRISVPYSPHRPAEIRKVELQSLLARCRCDVLESFTEHPRKDVSSRQSSTFRQPSESSIDFYPTQISRRSLQRG